MCHNINPHKTLTRYKYVYVVEEGIEKRGFERLEAAICWTGHTLASEN